MLTRISQLITTAGADTSVLTALCSLRKATLENCTISGYDRPEAHAVQKDKVMYYAFYAESYDGELELRGLEEGLTYNVRDYYNDSGKGSVTGPEGKLQVSFSGSLLLEAVPIDN